MSKKDFVALAKAIMLHNKLAQVNRWVSFSHDHLKTLADFCQTQNPRFNRERWLDFIAGKCGPNGGAR